MNKDLIRICAECGKRYHVCEKGAGYKYCSRHCAKTAQAKQIQRWCNDNQAEIDEWKKWWRSRKFQDKYAEWQETTLH